MNIELQHPYEQIAEQIMYAKRLPSISAAVEQALEAFADGLSEEESTAGLHGMLEAGLQSGPSQKSSEEIFAEIYAALQNLEDQGASREEHAA